MATINSINSNIPIELSKGGTNATSMATTDGTIYYDGTRLVTTATGNSGQILTSNGAGVAPTYQTLVSGGWVEIQTQDASASASLDFTTSITSYTNFLLVWHNYLSATNGTNLLIRVSDDAGSTWKATTYISSIRSKTYNVTTMTESTNTTGIEIFRASSSATSAASGFQYLTNRGTTRYLTAVGTATGGSTSKSQWNAGYYNATLTVNGFQLISSSGNLASGTFTLYGLSNS